MTPPHSDHFNGKTFFNPGGPSERSWIDVLRWQLTSKPARWPRWIEIEKCAPPPVPTGEQISVTWINHATFLLRTARGNILTDPVFSERCSPVSWAGPRRVHAPGLALDELPSIQAVLLSHDHYDHCDLPSLQRIARDHDPEFVAPLRHRGLLESAGARRISELDWWQQRTVWPGCDITLTPSRHWSRRSIGTTNRRLWGGFALNLAGKHVWFAGDTAYDETLFREIRRRCGAPDLGLIPIGAYEPRWFMRHAHMNPSESVRAHLDIGARRSVAMHWGTFRLTDEAREDPPTALIAARKQARVDSADLLLLAPGEHVVI